MEVIRLNGNKIEENTVCAIGFFDGLHLAHKRLIETSIKIAKEKGLKKAVITFDVHPKSILFDLDYKYLTPLDRKIEILEDYCIDYLYVIQFDKEKAQLHPDEFIDFYLSNIDTLVCGFDFKFGVRGSGKVEDLKASKHFDTVVVEEIKFDGYKVGSTYIRDLLKAGRVDEVTEYLGDYYKVKGHVIHGRKKGRMIGYPTANIDTNDYLIPKKGVYATLTKVRGRWYKSMSSVGHNPTLNCRVDLSVESNIFDFNDDIYGEVIELKFIKRLRDEEKFDSIDALIAKIDQDKLDTLALLENIK
jgi:riboflavin kinase/FMN adenylyltransferase